MKIALVLTLFLTGCATSPTLTVANKYNSPEASIMLSCPEFIKPTTGTPAAFMQALTDNRKLYSQCSLLNESKKKFIELELK